MKRSIAAVLLIASSLAQAAPFTDVELAQTLQSHDRGMIYVWSPLMPLSIQGLEEARRVATEMGLGFTAVVDAQSASLVPQADSLESNRLLELGVLNHFPTVAVYEAGALSRHLIPGYEVPAGLKVYVNAALNLGPQPQRKRRNPNKPVLLEGVRATRSRNIVRLNQRPQYFFKASADGRYLSYTLPPADPLLNPGTNNIHNVSSGTVTEVPGPWDPVFNIDADVMTLPIRALGRGVHYGFYSVRDLLRTGKRTPFLAEDTELKGLYQSVAVLDQDRATVTYRIITEGTGMHGMRDYIYTRATQSIVPTTPAGLLCTNFNLKLPMIAKNGLEVGALDVDSQTTGIFRIGAGGTCTKVLDLGIRTGKTNFSHDGTQVTFHIYSGTSDELVVANYVMVPTAQYSSNIFVLDRATNTISKITNNTQANALYPDFLRNGQVVYAYYAHNQTNMEFRFVELR